MAAILHQVGNNISVTTNDIDEYNYNVEVMATADVEPPPGYDTNVTTALDIPNIAAHLWYFRQVSGCTLTNLPDVPATSR